MGRSAGAAPSSTDGCPGLKAKSSAYPSGNRLFSRGCQLRTSHQCQSLCAALPSLAQGGTGVFLKPAHDTESACSEATASKEPDASTNAPAEKEPTLSTESSAPCITDEKWRQHREERRAQLAQRKEEDEQWRSQLESIRERLAELPVITAWFCILVIIDNCTRIC